MEQQGNFDFNLECDDLRNGMIQILNSKKIPIGAVYYIFKDIYHDVEMTYVAYINGAKIKKGPQQNITIGDIDTNDDNDEDDENQEEKEIMIR